MAVYGKQTVTQFVSWHWPRLWGERENWRQGGEQRRRMSPLHEEFDLNQRSKSGICANERHRPNLRRALLPQRLLPEQWWICSIAETVAAVCQWLVAVGRRLSLWPHSGARGPVCDRPTGRGMRPILLWQTSPPTLAVTLVTQ